jgi:lipopolysaccharide export system protein LptA
MDPYAEIVDVAVETGDVTVEEGKQRVRAIAVDVTYNGTKRMPMRFEFEPPKAGHLSPRDIVAEEFRKMGDALQYLATDDGRKLIRSRPQRA